MADAERVRNDGSGTVVAAPDECTCCCGNYKLRHFYQGTNACLMVGFVITVCFFIGSFFLMLAASFSKDFDSTQLFKGVVITIAVTYAALLLVYLFGCCVFSECWGKKSFCSEVMFVGRVQPVNKVFSIAPEELPVCQRSEETSSNAESQCTLDLVEELPAWQRTAQTSCNVESQCTADVYRPATVRGKPTECILCCDEPINCRLLPCAHTSMCVNCAARICNSSKLSEKICPECRQLIHGLIKLY